MNNKAVQGIGELNSTLTGEQQKHRDCPVKGGSLLPQKGFNEGEVGSLN